MLITGGSTGLGLNVTRQLAAKGANVIIVARNVDKLRQGIDFVSVTPFLLPDLDVRPRVSSTDSHVLERRPLAREAALPLHQCRCDQGFGMRSRGSRIHLVEWRRASRHRLVLQRECASISIHRHADRAVPDHAGQQLRLLRIHGTCYT